MQREVNVQRGDMIIATQAIVDNVYKLSGFILHVGTQLTVQSVGEETTVAALGSITVHLSY